jgi:hypothetical protein
MQTKTKGIILLSLVALAAFSMIVTASAATSKRDKDQIKDQTRDRLHDKSCDCTIHCVRDQIQLHTKLQTRDV